MLAIEFTHHFWRLQSKPASAKDKLKVKVTVFEKTVEFTGANELH